jgi:hypothetical protein
MSKICLPFFGFDSELEPTSNSEAFTSATNDFFERCYAKGSYGTHTTSQCLSLSSHCPSLFAA